MNAPATRRRKRKPTSRKYVFIAQPQPGSETPLAVPALVSAWGVCPEYALRAASAMVPIGWTLTLAADQ